MNSPTLHFYFDYISPFAYFAWIRTQELSQNYDVKIQIHPVVFGKLLDHWGQLGPAEITPKREWLLKYCNRYAKLNNIELRGPKLHPFNPLPALRLSLLEVAGDRQQQVVSAIYEAGWSHGKDISSTSELIDVLTANGFSEHYLTEAMNSVDVKTALKHQTQDAINRGVFGVPTIIIDDELFWGNDQFEHIALYLEGEDPLDQEALTAGLARKRGIDRKKIQSEQP